MDRFAGMTTFTTVVNSGSFAGAARRLNLSPAAVTKQIQSIEERLGARLLNRSTRNISLTEEGAAYYDRCAHILAEITEAESVIREMRSTPRGKLRLSVATVLSFGLPSLVDGFGEAYPDVTLELFLTDHMVDVVEEGIDVAVHFVRPQSSSLIVRRLGSFHTILCAAPAYLEARGAPQEPADLAEHNCLPYIFPSAARDVREWTLIGPEGTVTVAVSGKLHTNSPEALVCAAIAGRGILRVGDFMVRDALRERKLVRVLPEHRFAELPVSAIIPSREHMSLKVRSFVSFAVRHFATAPQWQRIVL